VSCRPEILPSFLSHNSSQNQAPQNNTVSEWRTRHLHESPSVTSSSTSTSTPPSELLLGSRWLQVGAYLRAPPCPLSQQPSDTSRRRAMSGQILARRHSWHSFMPDRGQKIYDHTRDGFHAFTGTQKMRIANSLDRVPSGSSSTCRRRRASCGVHTRLGIIFRLEAVMTFG
jgi:hypothetical protein